MKILLFIFMMISISSCNKVKYPINISIGMNKNDISIQNGDIIELDELLLLNYDNYNYIVFFNDDFIVDEVSVFKENKNKNKNIIKYYYCPEQIDIYYSIKKFSIPMYVNKYIIKEKKYYEFIYEIDKYQGFFIYYEYSNDKLYCTSVSCTQINNMAK